MANETKKFKFTCRPEEKYPEELKAMAGKIRDAKLTEIKEKFKTLMAGAPIPAHITALLEKIAAENCAHQWVAELQYMTPDDICKKYYSVGSALSPRQIEKYTETSGKFWSAGDKKRIYFNDLAEKLSVKHDLKCTFFKTGNVATARLAGNKISNSKASGLLCGWANAKLWIDCNTGEINTLGLDEDDAAYLQADLIKAS